MSGKTGAMIKSIDGPVSVVGGSTARVVGATAVVLESTNSNIVLSAAKRVYLSGATSVSLSSLIYECTRDGHFDR
jgi:hypothetical protein